MTSRAHRGISRHPRLCVSFPPLIPELEQLPLRPIGTASKRSLRARFRRSPQERSSHEQSKTQGGRCPWRVRACGTRKRSNRPRDRGQSLRPRDEVRWSRRDPSQMYNQSSFSTMPQMKRNFMLGGTGNASVAVMFSGSPASPVTRRTRVTSGSWSTACSRLPALFLDRLR